MGFKSHKIDQKKRKRSCLVVRQSVRVFLFYNYKYLQDSVMDGIFFSRNANNLVALLNKLTVKQ